MMRLFIALNLPAESRKEINNLQKRLIKKHWPVRWQEPGKIHLTLSFLGERKGKQRLKLKILERLIKEACREIGSFELKLKGLGAFPDFIQPRVVWLGLKGDLRSLAGLQKRIKKGLTAKGIWFDPKPLVPHITVGRVKRGISRGALSDLGKKIRKLRKIDFRSSILINSAVVMESKTLTTGSVYEKLAVIKFLKD